MMNAAYFSHRSNYLHAATYVSGLHSKRISQRLRKYDLGYVRHLLCDPYNEAALSVASRPSVCLCLSVCPSVPCLRLSRNREVV